MKRYLLTAAVSLLCVSQLFAEIKHQVKTGETITTIAEKYGISVDDLLEANPKAKKAIFTGMTLIIPDGTKAPAQTTTPVQARQEPQRTTETVRPAAETRRPQRTEKPNQKKIYRKGANFLQLNAGIGSEAGVETGFAFQQKLQWEHCINDKLINGKAGFSIGAELHASQASDYMIAGATGHYDYSYTILDWTKNKNNRWSSSVGQKGHRSGTGYADVYVDTQYDFAALGTFSFHFQPTRNLDVYAVTGLGLSVRLFDLTYKNMKGMSEKHVTATEGKNSGGSFFITYDYNDAAHAKWEGGGIPDDLEIGVAFCSYAGARYFFTNHLAVNAELGITNCIMSSNGPTGRGILSAGLTFKF